MGHVTWPMYGATDYMRTIISSVFRIHVGYDSQDVPKNSTCTKDDTRSSKLAEIIGLVPDRQVHRNSSRANRQPQGWYFLLQCSGQPTHVLGTIAYIKNYYGISFLHYKKYFNLSLQNEIVST